MTTTAYVDANLHHAQVKGRAVKDAYILRILILLIVTPKEKLQLKLQLLGMNLW